MFINSIKINNPLSQTKQKTQQNNNNNTITPNLRGAYDKFPDFFRMGI